MGLAFRKAMRLTWVGSATPAFTRLVYRSVAALQPKPDPWRNRKCPAATAPPVPRLCAIRRTGGSPERRAVAMPECPGPCQFAAGETKLGAWASHATGWLHNLPLRWVMSAHLTSFPRRIYTPGVPWYGPPDEYNLVAFAKYSIGGSVTCHVSNLPRSIVFERCGTAAPFHTQAVCAVLISRQTSDTRNGMALATSATRCQSPERPNTGAMGL